MAASLLGETVHLTVTYAVSAEDANGNPQSYNVTLYDADLTVGAGTEVNGQAVTATFYSGGFQQTLSGTISFDVSASEFTSYFSGTQQPGEIKFTLTSVADESASSVSSATETASSGFMSGVNQPLAPTFTTGGTVTGGFFPFGYQPGVNLSQTVSIGLEQATNAPPTLTGDLTAAVAEGGSYVITNSDLGFSDSDDTASGVTFTVSGVTNGSVLVNGIAASSFTGTQLAGGQVSFLHDGSETTSAGFDVSVEDGNEDGSAPTASAFSFTVTPVNDAATATGLTAALTVAEDASATTLFTTPPVVADPDAGSTIAATLTLDSTEGTLAGAGTPVGNLYTITGTVAEVNTALAAVTFTPAADFNGSASVGLSVTDGVQGTPVTGTLNVTVTPVADAAIIAGALTNTATEDQTAPVTGTLTITDADGSAEEAFAAQASVATTYGTFSIDASGAYTYTLDNTKPAVQALNAGQTVDDVIQVASVDGTTQDVTITISGVNEPAPPPPPPVTQGTAGDDNISAGTSTTPTYGGAGSDNITATPAAGTTAQLFGGSATNDPNDGGDTISVSGAGSVVAYGNGGNDQITVTATGASSVYGGMGDDQVSVTNNAANSVVGGMGADRITITGNGNNQVFGGSLVNDPNDGGDRITISGNGNNTVYSNGGDDVIVITGSGSNTVYAGVGNDSLTGGAGGDVLVGGRGDNVYTGGAGSDTFVFTAGSRDIVTDFSFAQGDRLDVGGQAYSVTTASDGSAALVFADGGVIILQGVTQAEFTADFVA